MTKDMTTGSPLRIILLFSIPVLLGNLFQQFYNMVDTIIVGRYLGEEALAAVGSTGCLMFLVLGFANGIAQGFGVMVSHAFGAKDFRLLRHYVALSLILTLIISLLLTIPTVTASRLLLAWMHTPENIIAMADAYIKVIFAGILLTMAYNVVSGILRGIGDSRTPLYFLILSSVLNIILDVVLIVYTGLGTAGAAYATIIAQGVSAVLCFFYMYRKYEILRTRREDYYLDSAGVKNMLAIGVPMALNYSITAIGTMIMQSAVNVFGSSVVAAFTAASKVSNIATQSMPTLGTAMATYCGQNLGAGKYDRIYAGMRQGLFLCFGAAAAAAADLHLWRTFYCELVREQSFRGDLLFRHAVPDDRKLVLSPARHDLFIPQCLTGPGSGTDPHALRVHRACLPLRRHRSRSGEHRLLRCLLRRSGCLGRCRHPAVYHLSSLGAPDEATPQNSVNIFAPQETTSYSI